MRGLLIKDLALCRKSLSSYLVVVCVFAAVSLFGQASFSGMILMLVSSICVNSFSYDDMAHWNSYALCCPVTRRQLVGSKYLLGLILWGIGSALSLLLGGLSALNSDVALAEALLPTPIVGAMMLIALAITLPLLFKLGVEKARTLLIVAVGIPALAFTLCALYLGDWLEYNLSLLVLLLTLGALASYAVSFPISVRLLEAKDL